MIQLLRQQNISSNASQIISHPWRDVRHHLSPLPCHIRSLIGRTVNQHKSIPTCITTYTHTINCRLYPPNKSLFIHCIHNLFLSTLSTYSTYHTHPCHYHTVLHVPIFNSYSSNSPALSPSPPIASELTRRRPIFFYTKINDNIQISFRFAELSPINFPSLTTTRSHLKIWRRDQ